MGLFDFFKKKPSSEETPIEDGDKTVIQSDNTDDSAPGWEAIDAEFDIIFLLLRTQKSPNNTNTIGLMFCCLDFYKCYYYYLFI